MNFCCCAPCNFNRAEASDPDAQRARHWRAFSAGINPPIVGAAQPRQASTHSSTRKKNSQGSIPSNGDSTGPAERRSTHAAQKPNKTSAPLARREKHPRGLTSPPPHHWASRLAAREQRRFTGGTEAHGKQATPGTRDAARRLKMRGSAALGGRYSSCEEKCRGTRTARHTARQLPCGLVQT